MEAPDLESQGNDDEINMREPESLHQETVEATTNSLSRERGVSMMSEPRPVGPDQTRHRIRLVKSVITVRSQPSNVGRRQSQMVSPPEEQAAFASAATGADADAEAVLRECTERYIAPMASLPSEKRESLTGKNIHHAGPEPHKYGDVCRPRYRDFGRKQR